MKLTTAASYAAFLLLSSASALAQTCPADKECVPRRFTEWCHELGTFCNAPNEPDASPKPICPGMTVTGFSTYQGIIDWAISEAVRCDGYTSGTGYPTLPEEIITWHPTRDHYPILARQEWQLDFVTPPNGNIRGIWVAPHARRVIQCPEGYTEAHDATAAWCERPRVADCQEDCVPGNPNIGNPIFAHAHLGSEKTEKVTDYAGEHGLVLTRHYRSGSRSPNQVTARLAFGPKWLMDWEAYLDLSFTNMVRAVRPNGTQIQFNGTGAGWQAWSGDSTRLTQIAPVGPDQIAWRLTDRNERSESYLADGRLARIDYRDGQFLELTYDASGELTRVEARDGRAILFVWGDVSGARRVVGVQLPDGELLGYHYDTIWRRLESVSDSTGMRSGYAYDEPAHSQYARADRGYMLTGVVDANGSRFSTFTYDSDGRAVESSHAGEANLTTISKLDKSVVIHSPTQHERRLFAKFSGVWRVSTVYQEDCFGCGYVRTKSYTYDANGFLNLETNYRGVVTDRDHDAQGREIQRIESKSAPGNANPAEKRTIQTDWHASFRVPTERRTLNAYGALVAQSNWTYNPRGQVLTHTVTDPATSATRTTTTSYCEQADVDAPGSTCPLLGLVKSLDGPRTDVSDLTTYTYYAATDESGCAGSGPCHRKGDLWKVTTALGHITETLRYDRAGRVRAAKDANGVVTEFTYHPRGWLLTRTVKGATAPEDAVTTFTYDATGQVTRVTQPDGDFLDYEYDAAHRLVAVEDALGHRIEYTLDAAGNRTAEHTKDPLGSVTRSLSRVYNQLGRLTQQLDALSRATVFDHDANGNLTETTDALSTVAEQSYDPLDRLASTLQDVGGLAVETEYGYDALDRLVKVTDPKGLDTDYTYDGLGNLTQLDSPDTGITTYTYDAAGNRLTQTDARGITATYAYDALNRLTSISYPTSSLNVSFAYDQANGTSGCTSSFPTGRLTRITDVSGTTTDADDPGSLAELLIQQPDLSIQRTEHELVIRPR